MDQNQWFNTGSPAPMNDRQAFEAGWTAAQRQMAYSPQVPQINERIFQQTPQQTPPPRPTYLPGRVVNSPDDIRASEIPMDGTVAVFPSSDYSHVILKAWNSNGSIQTEIYQRMNPNAEPAPDPRFEEFKMALNERLDKLEKMLTSSQPNQKSSRTTKQSVEEQIVQNDNANFRALSDRLTQQEIDRLKAQLADKDLLINQLNLGISQRNQTENIVSQLKGNCGCNCACN